MVNKGNILVVDDDPNILEVLKINLSKKGYKVFMAFNPSEAIELLGSIPMDLVITDLVMNEASGLDLIKYMNRYNIEFSELFQDEYNL